MRLRTVWRPSATSFRIPICVHRKPAWSCCADGLAVMVAPFNVGEATVTRCAVQLRSGQVGFSYALGRDLDKARLAAVCDALWQSDAHRDAIERRMCFRQCGHASMQNARKPIAGRRRRASISSPWCAGRTANDFLLAPAFAEPGLESQSAFRAVMTAMSRPGLVQELRHDLSPPAPLSAGAATVALTLFDYETPVLAGRCSGRRGRRLALAAFSHRCADHQQSAAGRLRIDCGCGERTGLHEFCAWNARIIPIARQLPDPSQVRKPVRRPFDRAEGAWD